MRPPSEPAINKNNEAEWFIYWNHDVPQPLWQFYPRRRIRIRINDDINRLKDKAREEFAEERRLVWKYKLEKLNYNPFEDELNQLAELKNRQEVVTEVVEVNAAAAKIPPEQSRKMTPFNKAIDLWIVSRGERTKNQNTVATYRSTGRWLLKYFEDAGIEKTPISQVTRLQVAEALMARKKEKNWEATTYNNEYGFVLTFFIWLKAEEYIDTNPIQGKIAKMPTKKHKNKWYDKETKKRVKAALIEAKEMPVYYAMAFTYFLLIRSKAELMKLKAGDIDRTLKRVRFSAELSKTNSEAFRDYLPEFDKILDELGFDSIPKNFYLFGRKGVPSEYKCHKDLLATAWRPVRDELGLSDDYTIYGMKHTRIVHELFKGTEGYDISHMARHDDPKSTKEYMRDYDITLKHKYPPEELTF